MIDSTTAPLPEEEAREGSGRDGCVVALIIVWALQEPHRVGEIAYFGDIGDEQTFGRGLGDNKKRTSFYRQRPGALEPTDPIQSPAISRMELEFALLLDGLHVWRVGKQRMFINGVECEKGLLHPGDTLYLEGRLLLLCKLRSRTMPPCRFYPKSEYPAFGERDSGRSLGESPEAWKLRDDIAMLAQAEDHVLVLGETGTGKELAAHEIHALSRRRAKEMVVRNAATFTDTLISAELSGNREGFPNRGDPEQPGLLGRADGGTLFLDEIGDLPQKLQATLLRALNKPGDYQRLGETRTRSVDLRFIGATNRAIDTLKSDLAARIPVRLEIPPLDARREDIPFLARELLLAIADSTPAVAGRFVRNLPNGKRDVAIDGQLMDYLVRRSYPTNIRGINEVLWRVLRDCEPGKRLTPSQPLLQEMLAECRPPPARRSNGPSRAPDRADADGDGGLTEEAVRACLDRNQWVHERTAKELKLKDRYALRRLMQRFGIKPRRARQDVDE